MFPSTLKTFVHPHSVYRLEYPAIWDQVIEKNGDSCGFGPHDRDDVGLWISITPMSLDTDRIQEDLPKLMQQSIEKTGAVNLRRDTTLKHFGLIADMTQDNEGGHYWPVAGGDIVLFVSSQVPVAERNVWNPPFAMLMASLQITRDLHLQHRQVANEVLTRLKERYPDQDYAYDADDNIRGRDRVVFLSNVFREVRASPERRSEIIDRFVDTLNKPATADFGHEAWGDIRTTVVPVLKPRSYIQEKSPTRHLLTTEWLADVLICYAIKRQNMFRFVTGWDVDRWGLTAETVHEEALKNLLRLSWPRELPGARGRDSGRVIIVDTDDNLAASRLIHPDLYRLFSGPLGTPFWAGIPCRDRLVLYSDRRELKQRIGRRLKKDHDTSSYPITPRSFLVTRDGIAPGGPK